jgi:TRAP-type mannitol/chloroaromatic compound transport system permease small subunit
VEEALKAKPERAKSRLETAGRVFDRIILVIMYIACCGVSVLTLIVCFEVVMRTFFNRPSSWVGEFSGHILLFIPFMAGAWLLKKEEHVKMDLITNMTSKRKQALVDIFTSFTGIIICLITTWFTARVTVDMFQTGYVTQSVLRLPEWPLIAFLSLGFLLLSIQFIRRTYNRYTIWKGFGKKEAGEGLSAGY